MYENCFACYWIYTVVYCYIKYDGQNAGRLWQNFTSLAELMTVRIYWNACVSLCVVLQLYSPII